MKQMKQIYYVMVTRPVYDPDQDITLYHIWHLGSVEHESIEDARLVAPLDYGVVLFDTYEEAREASSRLKTGEGSSTIVCHICRMDCEVIG